jgi:hypothetical protein
MQFYILKETKMAINLQVNQAISATAQPVNDQSGKSTPLALSSDHVGIGTNAPISKLHIVSPVDASPPRVQSTPGGTGSFAAGWDFYVGQTAKGYVGVGNDGVGFGARELLLLGGTETKTSLWAGYTRGLTVDTSGNVGIGTDAPVSKCHILSGTNGNAQRLQSSPGGACFAAGWDFYPEGIGKAYVGVPDAGAGFGAGELVLVGGNDTKVSIWSGYNRCITVDTNGNVGIGTEAPTEKLEVNGNIRTSGDIFLTNADCAEDFNIGTEELVEPGTVMVLGDDAMLFPCQHAGDKRVVGVVSGAGDYKPGIVLDKQPSLHNRQPIALLGKVYCKVDAQYGAIEIGDLLTTSATLGHAMKCGNPARTSGAVIGKALRPHADGAGLIPVLITLL